MRASADGKSIPSSDSHHRFGLILALSAATLFSTKPILIKWLYSFDIGTLQLMWLRLAIALPFYLVVGWLALKKLPQLPPAGEWFKAAAVGLLGYYLASFLDLAGLQYVSAQLERLVLYAYPSLVVLLGVVFFKQPFKRAILLPLALTYIGLLLTFSNDTLMLSNSSLHAFAANKGELMKGTLLVVGSGLSFALYLLFSKKSIQSLGSLLFTCIAMTSATLATLVHGLIQGAISQSHIQFMPDYTPEAWAGVLALAILATVLPSFMVSAAIARIGPEKTSMSGTLGPVMTTFMAVWFLNEPLSFYSLAGLVLVVLGVWRLGKA